MSFGQRLPAAQAAVNKAPRRGPLDFMDLMDFIDFIDSSIGYAKNMLVFVRLVAVLWGMYQGFGLGRSFDG